MLYSFAGGSDGAIPLAGLTYVRGALYGTAHLGGADDKGTVFKMTTDGRYSQVYSFKGGDADGGDPRSALIDVDGTLYGTTGSYGAGGWGTVFRIYNGEDVLYSFHGSGDGIDPRGLTDVGGTLYGTTYIGGANHKGTVFKVTTSGKESVLHSFGSGHDGAYPTAPMTDVGGTLYGVTSSGGTRNFGTVFTITTSGEEHVLYSFGVTVNEGSTPVSRLTDVNGTLYGTTYYGGANNEGTVFKITTSGSESVLYSFAGGSDGARPRAVTDVGGTLYGTTKNGGANNVGVIFMLLKGSGKEFVLHNFGGGGDGAEPASGLTDVGGTLYGTTSRGGANDKGTIFSFLP